ncbi:MAG: translation initiation factor IF-2 [Clostridia bacterium]|nr:translation initiation factor IF-2 [Clostridia bacterium]
MARIKIYELAKELSVESKEIIRKLNKLGVEAKNHMSTISPKDADIIRASLATSNKGKAPANGEVFVPRVKRIPKAVIEQEQIIAQQAEEAASAEQAAAAAPEAPAITEPAPVVEPTGQAAEKEAKAKPETGKDSGEPAIVEPAAAAPPEPDAEAAPPAPAASKAVAQEQPAPAPKQTAAAPPTPAPPSAAPAPAAKAQPQDNRGRKAPAPGERQPYNKATGGKSDVQRPAYNKPAADRPQGSRPPQAGKPQGGKPQGGRPQGGKPQGGRPLPAAAQENKPTTYRPGNKKVFVKDMVFERTMDAEKARGRGRGKGKGKGKGYKDKSRKDTRVVMPPVAPKKITIGETVVLGELAKSMGKTAAEIIKKLFLMGIMATINQELDAETAILLADEFGITVEIATDRAAEIMEDIVDDEGDLHERPPVVTIMGHVDHGKTSLLDAIRHTNVVSAEAGGIAQHIGAYQVEIKGKKITFLDTPGHEAFTAMRARGANMTDIAVIVVAADDGVMPQTAEAINHCKAANVPIIIAINKIDKPSADSSRVRQELTNYGLVSEEWGGDTIMVEVSAKAHLNLEALLEMILLVAEVGELKANYDRQARGAIIEAKLDKNRGPVATLLVQKGTLHDGDNILAGAVFGKVRAMHDDKGHKVKDATPSMPVEVLGFSEVPPAGEIFIVVKDEKDARLVAAKQSVKKREEELHKARKISLDNLFQQIAEGDIKELNLVVKADVQGSVEALIQSLVKLNTDEVKVNVIHSGVGAISESDVMLSSASNAIILGFNIIAPPAARAAAEAADVDIRVYRVIYDALEDIKLAMAGLLAPEFKENIIGHVEIRQVIRVPKIGVVAGSYVTSGKVTRNAQVRVIRDNAVIAEDKIESLRRFKDDAKEVLQGFECGIGLTNFHDIKEGDQMEVYEIEEIARQL